MAKVMNPLNSVEARGKFGGVIYNSWRGISYVKAFKSPVNPKTVKQSAIRSILADLTENWRGITQAQRDSWITYADTHPVLDWTGNTKRLTGLNWFLKCNIPLRRNAILYSGTAPTVAAPASVSGLVMTLVTGDIQIEWDAPTTGSLAIEFYFGYSASPGRKISKKDCTYTFSKIASETQPVEVLASAADGGYALYAHVLDLTTGLCSPDVKVELVVT